ncbi:chromosome segregation protein SMC [Candidatus Bathyarchaeota archaeon]|nr:MAG: chromosome segregation protein SMC [Candidatus Bathyarchaeota archaeon]
MVFIKRIDIRGFKTFSKKVSISLDRGFTVITGPNGSGKSNILDGLKFALGELSPKELRGASLSDLVHKSQAEGARSAHVAVQFENGDRRIPVESDLVTISREFSKGGEGIYRLNGRRMSRKQVQDILSSADIQVSGFNMIAQHAITRLAEIGSEERRRILEELIGIGVFEAKKAEAKQQLQQADVNLKVAAARVDEVRTRIEQLELERNNLLRFQLLKREIGGQQARILSGQVAGLERRRTSLSQQLEGEQEKLDAVRVERDALTKQRVRVEAERQRFEETTVTKGNQELFDIERKVAEAGSEMVKARTEVETRKNILSTRTKQHDALLLEAQGIESKVKDLTASIRSLSARGASVEEKYVESLATVRKLAEKSQAARESLVEDEEKLGNLLGEIDGLSRALVEHTVASKSSSTKLDLTAGTLQSLEVRRQEFSQMVDELKLRIRELERLEKDEGKRLLGVEERAAQNLQLKGQKEREVEEALDVAKRARVTVIEFNTQKSLADSLQAEERALQKLEEMAKQGALDGILGRLEELVKFGDEHRKAVEAASAGWMSALVVKDLSVAVKCIESLKRTKLGRVKLIPLDDLELKDEGSELTETVGVVGPLSAVIRCDKMIAPAVEFVFGDTVLASNQKAAFLTAASGRRCVVISGDLYEPGGGLESGYYRAPFDVSTLVPRYNALEGLEKTRETLMKEVEAARKSLERLREALQTTRKRIGSLEGSIEREKQLLDEMVGKQVELKKRLSVLEEEKARMRVEQRRQILGEMEQERVRVAGETEALLREKLDLESKLASQHSSLDTLRPNYDPVRIQLRSFESEIGKEESRVKEALGRMEQLQQQVRELEHEKNRVVESLGAVSGEREKYNVQFGEIEKKLQALLEQMDPVNSTVSELKAGLREVDTQLAMWKSQLSGLGLEAPLEVGEEVVREAEELKRVLQDEMDEIGAVNQLAVQQYDSQKDGYKQLSVRITELEREKLGIIDFMNELESKKRDAFMSAFNRVNDTFQSLFAEMTDGQGHGRMALENPDSPFEGGLDVFLQFPGKPELTMGSASGGEKSVATVCYLLALQQIHPMPYYVMDEIDAHLDVLNTKRLATLVRSRSKGSQFIVISLKDTTISRADRVYGVFQEKGMSQVISLPARAVAVD